MGETCVEVGGQEALVASLYQLLCLGGNLLCRHTNALGLQESLQIVFHHLLRLLTDERLVAELLVVVALLYQLHPLPVEGVELDAVDVGPVVVEPHLLYNDDTLADADAEVVAVSVAALILVADEHLLPLVPHGNVNTRVAEGRQDAVKQTLVDCLGQCCHGLVGLLLVEFRVILVTSSGS